MNNMRIDICIVYKYITKLYNTKKLPIIILPELHIRYGYRRYTCIYSIYTLPNLKVFFNIQYMLFKD